MTQPRCIVGAGLAGLIAAHAWPGIPIFESQPAPAQAHRALLRFRSNKVAQLTGVEFRQVRVHKGIWSRGAYVVPGIAVANLYARKCLGALRGERSIWNIDPVDRWVAPDDFYGQLLEAVGVRVQWGTPMDWGSCNPFAGENGPDPIISTAPMPEVLNALSGRGVVEQHGFARAPIYVLRGRVLDADVFQTVYFPDPETALYRASITGSTLIAEFIGGEPSPHDDWARQINEAFGLDGFEHDATAGIRQRYGKIAPIDDAQRKGLLFTLTHQFGIFSLGRFATWRNILLDDVVDDIAVVKRLLRANTAYDVRRTTATS